MRALSSSSLLVMFGMSQNYIVASGVRVKDFMLNVSVEKCARARNEFSDALLWLVIVCCSGKKIDNIFSATKAQLTSINIAPAHTCQGTTLPETASTYF